MQDTNETGKASHFGDFQSAILLLDDFIQSLKEKNPEESQITLENWCEMAVEISNFKTQLSIIYNSLTHHLLKEMTETEMVVLPSGDTVEKKWDKNRKAWKHKDLADVVSEKIESLAIDMDTGERVLSTKEMITALLDYVQPSYWRVTALSNIGVNADDYCQSGEAEPSISLRKGK